MSKVWKRDVDNVTKKLFLEQLKNIITARYTMCFCHNYNYCDTYLIYPVRVHNVSREIVSSARSKLVTRWVANDRAGV